MAEFKNTMRYQLATFKQPDGGVPNDPKETQRQRELSADPKQYRDRTKSKENKTTAARKKTTDGYILKVQKSIDKPTTPSEAAQKVESKKSVTPTQKIKRQAPTPPKGVTAQPSKSSTVQKTANDNPFLDDDEDDNTGNPFLDDDGLQESESGNPFLDDEEEAGTNPFLD